MVSIGFVLFLFLIPTSLLMLFVSWGSKTEITLASPEYASRLYHPVSSQFYLGNWPIRSRVLFFDTPPPKVLPTIRLLRGIYAAHWLVLSAFLGCVLVGLVGGLAA